MKLARQAFTEQQLDLDISRIIFIDESGCQIGICRDYSWSKKGNRAVSYKFHRPKRINIIGGLTVNGLEAVMTVDGNVDGTVFTAFVEKILADKISPGQIIIMDNLSVHLNKKSKEIIENKGGKIIYLPPYSPDFNPIENCWSKLKNTLKGMVSDTIESLEKNIAIAIEKITSENSKAWMKYCGYAV